MKRLWVLACAVGLSACPACFQLKLDDGHPFPCDPDAGEDPADGGPRPDGGPAQCNTGWRCGLERRCHPRGEVADYACTDDSWCEGEWTCGSSGRCGPLIPDGLRLDAGEGPVTVRWRSPLLLDHVPDHVSVAPEEPVFSSYNVSAIAFTEKNRFTEVVRSRFGPPGDPITGAYQNVIFTAALPTSDVRDVMVSATLAPAPLLLTDQGVGYLRGDASADGGAVSLVVPPEWRGVRGDRLRVAAGFGSPLFPLALVLGDAGVITQLGWPSDFPPAPGAGAGFGALPVPALVPFGKSDGGLDLRLGGTVSDLTIVSSAPGSSAGPKDTVLATIDDRLYVSERWLRTGADGGYLAEWQVLALTDAGQVTHQPAPFQLWSFAALGQTQGAFEEMKYDTAAVGYRYGDAGVYRPGRLRSVGDRVAIEAFGSDSAEPQLLLAQLSYLPAPQGGDLVPLLVLQMPPCSACPLGYRLSDFRPVGESVMEARCETLTAGPELTVGLQPAVGDFRCASAVVAGGQGALGEHVLPATSLVGHGGWAGGHGQLWVGESLADTRPLFLDRPPQALISEGTDVAAIDHRTFFFSDDQLGFIGANGLPPEPSLVPVSSVLGREDWTLTGGMLLGRRATGGFGDIGGSAVAVQGSSIDLSTVREPYLAAIARAGDGGYVCVASSNDGIFSADVTGIYLDGHAAPGTMEFRTVPAIRVPVRSLAAVDVQPLGEGPVAYAHAYALVGQAMFELVGATPEHWESARVEVPAGAVKVLADGPWGRLAFADGTVVSLPAVKKLAGSVSGAVMEDFFMWRGQPWALGATGLYRLEAPRDGGTAGNWVSGPALGRDGGAVDLHGARFYAASGTLFIVTAAGVALQLE